MKTPPRNPESEQDDPAADPWIGMAVLAIPLMLFVNALNWCRRLLARLPGGRASGRR